MRIPYTLAAESAAVCLPADIVSPALQFAEMHQAMTVRQIDATSGFDISDCLAASAAVSLYAQDQTLASSGWWAAVDPVSMHADMRDVRITSWPVDDLSRADADVLFNSVAALLADDPDDRLTRWQLRQQAPAHWLANAALADGVRVSVSAPAQLRGEALRDHPPQGQDARIWQRLSTELQMLAHASPVNDSRQAAGLAPVNGLWVYGGGSLPSLAKASLPPLRSDQPRFHGTWHLAGTQTTAPDQTSRVTAIHAGGVYAPSQTATIWSAITSALAARQLKRVMLVTPSQWWLLERRVWWRDWLSRSSRKGQTQ